MKQFFEQYGGVALGILALLVLIAIITPVGNIIKTSLQGTTEKFSASINRQTDTMSEQMEAAFVNATGFTGVKDHTFYSNGQVHPTFKENRILLNENGNTATDKNGVTYNIKADVNVILNDETIYNGGINNLIYDIYKNNILIDENAKDSFFHISLNNNDEIKIVIKQVPDGYRVAQNEYIYEIYDPCSISANPDRHEIYFCLSIYAYND